MAHHYKLHYFHGRGKGEALRLMMHYRGVKFEDITYDDNTLFAPVKNDMPFHQIPVLDVDGTKLAQSIAIARYLAAEHDLLAGSNLENAKVDMYVAQLDDFYKLFSPWVLVCLGIDKSMKKEEAYEKYAVPAVKAQGPFFEKALKDNHTGWVVGDKMTWGDIYMAEFFEKFRHFGRKDALDALPLVKAHSDKVMAIPAIKEYMDKRRESLF